MHRPKIYISPTFCRDEFVTARFNCSTFNSLMVAASQEFNDIFGNPTKNKHMWQSRTPTLPRWRSGCPTFATWRNCSQLTGVTGSTCLRQRLRSPPTTIVDEDHSNNGNNYSNNNNKQFTIHNISQPQQNCAHCDFLDTYCSSWYLHYLLWFSFFVS